MARLDRLAPTKEVVQLGATIGRAFSYELIRAVSRLDEATLRSELSRLVEAEVLYERGTPPATTYVFKHALIQDAAYESLVKGRRREYHLRIAEALEREFPHVVDVQPELLGAPLGRRRSRGGGDPVLPARRAAGGRALGVRRGDQPPAQRAEPLLPELADGDERDRREVELLIALGPVLVGTEGYSNPEVEQVYARARELCERLGGDARLRFTVTSGLLLFHQSRAELADLPRSDASSGSRWRGSSATRRSRCWCTRTRARWPCGAASTPHALTSLGEALARYSPAGGRAVRLEVRHRHVGRLHHATRRRRSSTSAFSIRRCARPRSRWRSRARSDTCTAWCWRSNFSASLHAQRGEFAKVLARSDEAHALATEQHLALWVGGCHRPAGRCARRPGSRRGGHRGVLRRDGDRAGHRRDHRRAVLRLRGSPHAYLHVGKPREGLDVLDGMCARARPL